MGPQLLKLKINGSAKNVILRTKWKKMMFKTKPYNYQKSIIYNAIFSLKNYKIHAFLMEVGTGKTLCSLYTALKMHKENLCDGIIIVPPKALISVWIDEINKHTNFKHKLFIWDNSKKNQKSY